MEHRQKAQIVSTAITQMYKGGHFNIITMKEIANLCGIIIPDETLSAMRLLHCVNFGAMPAETRDWLKIEIERLFSDPSLVVENNVPFGGRFQAISGAWKAVVGIGQRQDARAE